jgi:uncharacterized membrane protein YoaK (UPF0700 family)
MLRGWVDVQRTHQANVRLGLTLCFVAGATNAGGFLAVGQYTSHMTGVVSALADQWVLGQWTLVVSGLGALMAFLLGAMTTAWTVNLGLRRGWRSAYGVPLLLEAAALLLFGLFGTAIAHHAAVFTPLTVVWLCYTMGLQNAVITKVSHAEIRTTHLTGLLTDIGLALGRALYINRNTDIPPVRTDRARLRLQLGLVAAFFGGALAGAWGFKAWGYVSTLPLAALLLLVVWRPLAADLWGRPATRQA